MVFVPNALFNWNGGDLSVLVEGNLDSGSGPIQCRPYTDARFDTLIAIWPE
jgi:hypothetical protein